MTDGTEPESLEAAAAIAKSPFGESEDVVAITARHVGVFDGMSSPLQGPGDAPSGRAFALAAARAVLEFPAEIQAADAIRAITAALASIDGQHPGPQGAVGAIVSIARREVWRVGDVHVQIGQVAFPGAKAVDTVFTEFRAAVNLAAVARGASVDEVIRDDPGLAAASTLLEVQPIFANREGELGYGVFDGSHVPESFIEIIPIPEGGGVTLASDGYPVLTDSLAEAEAYLRSAIERDPACIGELREMGKPMRSGFRAPDDRSYVRLHPRAYTEGT